MNKLLLYFALLMGGMIGTVTAQTGSAIDFDGINDYVNVPASASLSSYSTTNQITIEYWVKPDAGLGYTFEPLVSKRFTANVSGFLVNKINAAGLHNHWLRFTTGWVRVDATYPTNVWSHVAVTYRAGAGMRVYVNGVLAASNPINGTLVVNGAPLQLGGETASAGFKYNGQMDEFRLWSRALTGAEVLAGKDCEISGGESGLIAYYQFNQGVAFGSNPAVTTVPDLSGNGNTGTLQNFALNGATSNWIAPGGVPCSIAAGAALDFDGDDNYVNVPSTSTLESYGTTNAITVEYWVNPDPTLNYVPTPTEPQAFEPLISKRYTSNTAGILIDKLTAAGDHTHWLRFTTGWERIDVPYPTSSWSHVAMTYKSGDGMKVYVNGVLVGSNPINGSLVVNDAPLQIGGETAVYNYKYRGQIDEFRLWDRALSASELNARKDCELSGTEAGLLAYYQFNEGIAFGANPGVTSLPDVSGNGHTGTLNNFVLNGANSNWVAPGGVASGTVCNVISLTADVTDENCPGANDGAIDLTPSGGNAPYSFNWSNGATTEDVGSLAPGSYSVTVTDVDGTTATESFTINAGTDTTNPTIVCNSGSGDITVNNDPGECGAVISYNVAPADNCTGFSVAQTSGFANATLHPVGTTTNTFVVTDGAGNSSSCSFDVTVIDNEAPTLDCSLSGGPTNLLASNSFEDASFDALYNSPNWTRTGAFFGIDGTIIPAAQDGRWYLKSFGGDSRISQVVPVSDGDVLTVSAYAQNASFDPIGAPGGGYIQLTLVGGPAAVITSPFIVNTAPLNVWQLLSATVTVPSGVGYTGVQVELITQQPGGGAVMWDNASVSIGSGGLAGDVVVDNDPGVCGANVAVATPLSSDNCEIVSITNDQTGTSDASGFYPIGTTTINWEVTDAAGFTATCSNTVTVNDTEAPTIVCSTGFPDPAANLLNNNSFETNNGHDQQFPASWTQFGPVFTLDQGVIGTAQDADFYAKMFSANAGLFQDHPVNPGDVITGSIYIQNASFDPMGPVGGGQVKLEWPGTGAPQAVSAVVGASSPLDEWVQVSVTATAPAGATTVRFVAITNLPAGGAAMFDNAFLGNATSGDGGAIIVNNDPGECGAVISYNVAPADNCTGFSVAQTSGFANATLHPVGTTTNTFVVTDGAGNSSSCSFDVTVIDNEAPTLDCSLSGGPTNLLASNSFEDASFDALYNSPNWTRTGAFFGIDGTIIPAAQDGRWYLKSFGGDSRISQVVPVSDGDVLTVSAYAQNASFDPIGAPGGGYIQLTLVGGPAAVITSPFIVNTAPLNVWQLLSATVTVPSGVGYTGVRVELITQQPGGGAVMWDNASVSIGSGGLAGDVVVDNDPGVCGANVAVATPLNTDNCGVVSITNDQTGTSDASGFYPIGTTTINWEVTDAAGFTATCSNTVTVNDTEAPTIVCNTGAPDPTANLLNNNSFETNNGHDQQFPASWTQFGPVFTLDQGVIGTAQDADFYAKMFSANAGLFQDHPVNPGDVITGSIYIQNASFDPMGPVGGGQVKLEWPGTGAPQAVSAVVGASSPLDEWVQVSVTATAPAGATTVRFVAITNLPAGGAAMFDNAFLGNATSGDGGDIIVSNDAGVCGAIVSYTNLASDNCPGETVTQTAGFASGTVHPVGTTTNTFEVTDAAGNTSTCSFEVTIGDDEAPAITCPADLTLDCPANTDPSATGTASATDNCTASPSIVSSDASTPGCGSTETIVRTWTATDSSGNVSSCTQTIAVQDITAPALTCPADIALSTCESTATWSVVSSDACGSATVVSDPPSGSTFAVGSTNTVNVTSTDECGNVSDCSFLVTRADAITLALCDDTSYVALGWAPEEQSSISVSLTSGGDGSYTYEWSNGETTPEIVVAPDSTTTYCVTVTDASGCTEEACHTVVVVDVRCASGASSSSGSASSSASGSKSSSSSKSGSGSDNSSSKSKTKSSSASSGSDCGADCDAKIVMCHDNSGSSGSGSGSSSASEKCVSVCKVGDKLLKGWSIGPCGSPSFEQENCGEPDFADCNCNGALTSLTVRFDGDAADVITATSNGTALGTFSVTPGQILTVSDADGLGNKVEFEFDNALCGSKSNSSDSKKCKVKIKSDCSDVIVGGVFGPLAVISTQDITSAVCTVSDDPCNGCGTLMCEIKSNGDKRLQCVKAKDVEKKLNKGWVLGPCDGSTAKVAQGDAQGTQPTAAELDLGMITMNAYPNPFSSTTTIEFQVPATDFVTIEVYSLTGVKVATLFDAQVDAGRKYDAQFQPEGKANGIYFARLTSESGKVIVQKLILKR